MMKKIVKLQKNNQGFTLVELMIVVAIIGILAAIAIPQFAAYRIRGFNTAALSDLKNVATEQSAFFADWQSFGVSVANDAIANPMVYTGSAAAGAGALITGPPTATNVNVVTINVPFAGTARGFTVGLSNQVSMQVSTETITALIPRASSYLIYAKHLNGNTLYAQDGDNPSLYQDFLEGSNGAIMVANVVVSVQGTDQLVGAAAPSTVNWEVK